MDREKKEIFSPDISQLPGIDGAIGLPMRTRIIEEHLAIFYRRGPQKPIKRITYVVIASNGKMPPPQV